ncbi:MAG: HAD family hydrolase [Okeania sp. SIO2G4]|uniref:HAD family hydrolase n=1 Tax=unclassified Okeania TaxID=2634635 RepID=UPI0013B884F5|nr:MULTISPECIES: HAD family hydrolase [unclassified Okeania]NEP08034.1 HAD family hydrolase [Okeania sp. SIO4D6]NEP44060.1 HAD family hydrolase [Okeania sp. SIO2H7]NEP74535.1 HAD family hydrolase [Okeania sp. SIO2G5]NEP95570.1 HAD family hydrolase [Okeania sp. SIO2F5]NEQ93351.1 HAD family hydrolase [Okeania sp. SIO2G4]
MTELFTLIFDVDGTLANTERDGHRIAFNQAFATAGLDWEWSVSLYGELLEVAGGKERINFYISRYQPEFKSSIPLQELIYNLHAMKTQYYQRLLATGTIPLRLGVKRLLAEARNQKIRLAIATTSTLQNVTALLENTLGKESLSWFEIIAAGDIVPQKKPAPDIYYYVLEKMNLQPDNCLVFEDSDNGLKAALTVGLKTIVTVNDYTQNQDFTGATLVLNHLGEPDKSFTVIAGDAKGKTYIDMNLIDDIINFR